MEFLSLQHDPIDFLALALAPGVFWLWRIYLGNTHRPDPKNLVLRTFLFGALMTIPVIAVERLVMGFAPDGMPPAERAAYESFLVAGAVEETAKFLAVFVGMYWSTLFDEPMSGLVYGAAAALGFATAENFVYMAKLGPAVILFRAFSSTIGHVYFSALWAYPLGRRKLRKFAGKADGWALVVLGLAAAVVAHGIYDYCVLAPGGDARHWFTYVFLGLAALSARLTRRAAKVSPRRGRVSFAVARCAACAAINAPSSEACSRCGAVMAGGAAARLSCVKCDASLQARFKFCTSCGGRLVKDRAWDGVAA